MATVQGIDLNTLVDTGEPEVYYPSVVPGRRVHIDGDFIAYECSADTKLDWDGMCAKMRSKVEYIQRMSASEHFRIHLTAASSNKGGRYTAAMLREYQATRKKEKPEFLERMREFMRDELDAVYWIDREADDGMAQANYMALSLGRADASIIASRDKDLRMVPGWHFDMSTGECIYCDEVGSLELKQCGSTKKLTGWGWSFFFAQMLMGDTADNIGGLPAIYGMPDIKPGTKCGPVAAYNLLNGATLQEMLATVCHLYYEYAKEKGFVNWRDPTHKLNWREAFYSEAKLLWMQRGGKGHNDVMYWLRDRVKECA